MSNERSEIQSLRFKELRVNDLLFNFSQLGLILTLESGRVLQPEAFEAREERLLGF
jgi:hypothetical protein